MHDNPSGGTIAPARYVHQCPPNCGKEHGGKPKCNNWHCKVCGCFCICSECHGTDLRNSRGKCKACERYWEAGGRFEGSFFECWVSGECWVGGGDATGKSLLYTEPGKDDGIVRVTQPKRVTVPTFEIASNPQISIDEIKKRRFRRG
jgi:hypothetical protein